MSPLACDLCLTFICRPSFISGKIKNVYVCIKKKIQYKSVVRLCPVKFLSENLLVGRETSTFNFNKCSSWILDFISQTRRDSEEKGKKTCPESIKPSFYPKLLFYHDNRGLNAQYVTFASRVLSIKTIEWYSVEHIPEARQQRFQAQLWLLQLPIALSTFCEHLLTWQHIGGCRFSDKSQLWNSLLK